MLAKVAVGLTVMVNVAGVPKQPLAVPVTVMVEVMGVVPVFNPVNAGMFPLPEAAKPIAVLLLVHVNVVPVTLLPGVTNVEVLPWQMVWLVMGFTFGVGYTSIL